MRFRQGLRGDAGLPLAADGFEFRDEFDAFAALAGGLDVGLRDVLDALHLHAVVAEVPVGAEAGQDREFVRGVEPADVQGGWVLGVPERLRFGEGLRVVAALFHLRQDVQAGTVQHGLQAREGAGAQHGAHGADDGRAGHHGRLVVQFAVQGVVAQFVPAFGQQSLVGRDDGPSGAQVGAQHGHGKFHAAHRLDHDLALLQEGGVGGQGRAGRNAAFAGRVAHEDAHDLDAHAQVREDRFTAFDQVQDVLAHGATAEHAHSHGSHAPDCSARSAPRRGVGIGVDGPGLSGCLNVKPFR